MQKDKAQRPWSDVIYQDIMVFIRVIIYIGVYLEANIASYWNIKPIAPIYILSLYISLCRYKQIKRYLYISCSIIDISLGFYLLNND
jgi:hypothetical protein